MKAASNTCTNRQTAGRDQFYSPLQDADPTGSRAATFGVQLGHHWGSCEPRGGGAQLQGDVP